MAMENISLDFEWDKNYRKGYYKLIEARNNILPPSETLTAIPRWETILERQQNHASPDDSTTENVLPAKVKTFIPGKVFFHKEVDSTLTKREQAISLNILRLYQTGFDPNRLTPLQQQDIQIYKTLQSKIQEENTRFLQYVKGDWQKRCQRAAAIKSSLRTYAYSMWEKKLKRSLSYARFYKAFNIIPLAVQDYDPPVNVAVVKDILQLGTVAKFSCPTLLSKYAFKVCSLPPQEDKHIYNSKLPVSQDAHIQTLVDNHDVDVVVSASTLKRLMDDSNFTNAWDIPVVVKKCNTLQGDGSVKTRNIVYIDKPLPKQNPTNIDFNEQCHKRLIRTNLCQIPVVVYANSETTRMNPNYYESTKRTRCDSKTNKTGEEEEINDEKIVNETSFSEDGEGNTSNSGINLDNNVIHHNATYSIWNIKLADDQNVLMKTNVRSKNLKFLVRSKLDACEVFDYNIKRPVIIRPKLEFQLEHGAAISTKTELIRQWTDLFFRPYSNLYRVRLQPSTSEVVSVENVSMQKINNEAMTHYQYKPHLRLGVLYTVFSVLNELESGNYLLHHTSKVGPFVEILKEETIDAEQDKDTLFDLHSEYGDKHCSVLSSMHIPWCPIDVHYILPVHSTFKRMPGMFKPLLVTFVKKNTQKKAAKKKSKQRKKAKNNKKSKAEETKS